MPTRGSENDPGGRPWIWPSSDFLRRTDFNATGFFKPANGHKPQFDRDQYGAVIGGPIVKNRAFFFGDLEIFRQTRGQPAISSVPTTCTARAF